MGSFSANCGITNLTIGCGDDCVLLPLIAKKVYENGKLERKSYAVHPSVALFTYNDDMWEPFCFPIRGKYNDYGGLEDIIEDDNTKRLEEYFNLKIQDIVDLFTDVRRDVYDSYSKFCEVFYVDIKDLEYDANLKDFLLHLGFEEKENIYLLEDCKVMLDKDSFIATLSNDEKKFNSRYDKEDFLDWYFEKTGNLLGIKNKEVYDTLSCVGGMFILGETYDFYAKNHLSKDENIVNKFSMTKFVLLDNGFETNDFEVFSKKVNNVDLTVKCKGLYSWTLNEESINSMEDFMKVYKKLTNEDLDVSKYNGLDVYDWAKLELTTATLSLKNMCNSYFKYIVEEDLDTIDWNNKNSIKEFIEKHYFSIVLYKEDIVSNIGKISDYKEMENIYLTPLLIGELLDAYTEFERLHCAMILTNIVYKPSFGATQCGCNEAEVKYAYIVNKIVKERVEALKQEWNDYEEINPMEGFNERFY